MPFIKWKKGVDILMRDHFDEKKGEAMRIMDLTVEDRDLRFRYLRLKWEEKSIAEEGTEAWNKLQRY